MMYKINKILLTTALFVAAFSAQALPTIKGQIEFYGSYEFVTDTSGDNILNFLPDGIFGPDTGGFFVGAATDSFSLIDTATATGTIKDLNLDSFTGPLANFWSVADTTGNTFSFELDAFTTSTNSQGWLDILGTGTISATNLYDSTAGAWEFRSTSVNGGTFSWVSETVDSVAVPEPGVIWLLSAGLLAGAVSRKMKLN